MEMLRDVVCLSRVRFLWQSQKNHWRVRLSGSVFSELTLLKRATVRKPELWNNHRRCHGRVVIIVAAVVAVRRLRGAREIIYASSVHAHSYNTRSVQRSRVRARKNARRESIKQHVEEYNWSFLVREITHSYFLFQSPGKKVNLWRGP